MPVSTVWLIESLSAPVKAKVSQEERKGKKKKKHKKKEESENKKGYVIEVTENTHTLRSPLSDLMCPFVLWPGRNRVAMCKE